MQIDIANQVQNLVNFTPYHQKSEALEEWQGNKEYPVIVTNVERQNHFRPKQRLGTVKLSKEVEIQKIDESFIGELARNNKPIKVERYQPPAGGQKN
jgi:hypothetical protein